ncbi:MAG TPA: hypothetical protein VF423_11860 [Actinomycetes bacterium]
MSPASRRDNGLSAPSYERLRDVETHLVDGLLERLRDIEIAAYSAPTPGRRGPYGDTVLPGGPSDGVWVDSRRSDEARELADRYLVEMADEMAWAGIVADFDLEAHDEVPRWPASEDVDEPAKPAPDALSGFEELRDIVPAPPVVPRADTEDHFEPPPPPPLPEVDTITRVAWAGALGGPLVLLLAALAGIPLGGWVGFLALAAGMAGFVTLVARMKDRPPTDSGPDDGAVV